MEGFIVQRDGGIAAQTLQDGALGENGGTFG